VINLNIGKRAMAVSGGRRGAHISASSGRRGSLALGWKGLFWRKKL
jgi:hypothetical protein